MGTETGIRGILTAMCIAGACAQIVLETTQDLTHWKLVSRANGELEHDVIFAAYQQSLEQLETKLLAVSTPGSPRLGQHLSFEDVGQMLGSQAASGRILAWVSSHMDDAKILDTTVHGEYVRVRAPVTSWEKAFHSTFHVWESKLNGQRVVRCNRMSLPQTLADDSHGIFHTVDFPAPHIKHWQPHRISGARWSQGGSAAASETITPAFLSSFYNIDSNIGSVQAPQAVFSTQGMGFSPSDLHQFQDKHGLQHEDVAKVIGGHANYSRSECENGCEEGNLDLQYIMSVARGTPTTWFYSGNTSIGDAFLEFLVAVANEPSPEKVLSMSWGVAESWLSQQIMDAFNREVIKLGLRGVSVLAASGDDGVASMVGHRPDPTLCSYAPIFPASSPYVTAVGGTNIASWVTSGQKGEVACQSNVGNAVITSGGGFSDTFPAPAYQKSAIQGYFDCLQTQEQPYSGYNRSGRAYPDLAMAAHNYEIIIAGEPQLAHGTSGSAPVVAAMVSLINARRIEAGAEPVGFLNPRIYQNPKAFNDVVAGDNHCTSEWRLTICCKEGFYATKGWDPVTGMGSVDFSLFEAAFASGSAKASPSQPGHGELMV